MFINRQTPSGTDTFKIAQSPLDPAPSDALTVQNPDQGEEHADDLIDF